MELKIITWIFPLLFLSGIDSSSRKQKEIITLLKQIHNGSFKNCHYYVYDAIDLQIGDDEIFSVFNGDHLADVKRLYKFFISANNYEEFYRRSAWARCNANVDLFAYTFSVAVLRYSQTQDVLLPNFYEINPFYFVKKDAIEKAMSADGNNTLIEILVDVNDITYFTEDVGVSSYYYFINLLLPFWIENDDFPVSGRNGELYLYFHQQLLARYNLERYALGLKPTQTYDYEHPIELGYENDLMYPDGELFPSRKNNEEILYRDVLDMESSNNTNANAYTYIKDWELKVRQLFDKGEIITYYSPLVQNMGLISSRSIDSGKFNYARVLLGNPKAESKTPSALEHYETSPRDPMFWPMLKRMMYFYYKFNNKYQQKSDNSNYYKLILSDFNISKLETYFNDFKIDLTNTIHKEDINAQATMKRLNHKTFNYKMRLQASQTTSVLVKVFIGPKNNQKVNQLSPKRDRFNFVEIDRFVERVERDKKIVRTSHTNNYYSPDRIMFTDFYNNVIDGFIEGVDYNKKNSLKYYGFPKRLLLPKGSENGTSFLLYVVAIPYNAVHSNFEYIENSEYDFNYPLNIPFGDEEFLDSNAHIQEVKIYHTN